LLAPPLGGMRIPALASPTTRNGPGFIATVRYDGDEPERSCQTVERIGLLGFRGILPVWPIPSYGWKTRNSSVTLIRAFGPLKLPGQGRTQ
jgi:hypothetical protein